MWLGNQHKLDHLSEPRLKTWLYSAPHAFCNGCLLGCMERSQLLSKDQFVAVSAPAHICSTFLPSPCWHACGVWTLTCVWAADVCITDYTNYGYITVKACSAATCPLAHAGSLCLLGGQHSAVKSCKQCVLDHVSSGSIRLLVPKHARPLCPYIDTHVSFCVNNACTPSLQLHFHTNSHFIVPLMAQASSFRLTFYVILK